MKTNKMKNLVACIFVALSVLAFTGCSNNPGNRSSNFVASSYKEDKGFIPFKDYDKSKYENKYTLGSYEKYSKILAIRKEFVDDYIKNGGSKNYDKYRSKVQDLQTEINDMIKDFKEPDSRESSEDESAKKIKNSRNRARNYLTGLSNGLSEALKSIQNAENKDANIPKGFLGQSSINYSILREDAVAYKFKFSDNGNTIFNGFNYGPSYLGDYMPLIEANCVLLSPTYNSNNNTITAGFVITNRSETNELDISKFSVDLVENGNYYQRRRKSKS